MDVRTKSRVEVKVVKTVKIIFSIVLMLGGVFLSPLLQVHNRTTNYTPLDFLYSSMIALGFVLLMYFLAVSDSKKID